jgi:hypothetical protein
MMIEKDISTIQILSDKVDLIWPNIKNKLFWESYKNVSINLVALAIILFLTTPATLIHFISIDKQT